MKKTLQTAMTAAMFAAAATAMTAGVSALPDNSQVEALEMFAQNAAAPGTTTMTLYGPPPVDYTDETNDCERIDTTTTTTTTDEPEILYGPPSVLFEHGDVNMDRKLDARDLTLLKRELIRYRKFLEDHPDPSYGLSDFFWDWRSIDVNNDEEFDKEDIKALRRRLTGKSKEQEEAEEHQGEITTTTPTTTMTTTTTFDGPTQTWPTTTASTVLTTVTMPLYGPPWVFTTTVDEPVQTDVTEELPQPVYGPMPVDEIT